MAIAVMSGICRRLALLAGLAAWIFSALMVGLVSAEPLNATGARIAGDLARTRIVIEFDRKPEFSVHYVRKPDRVIIDLDETRFAFGADNLVPTGLFSDIRYGRMGEDSSRIVLTAKRPVIIRKSEAVANENGKGFRLLIDAEMTTEEEFVRLVETATWALSEKIAAGKMDRIGEQPDPLDNDFLVAIDAGHGGIDTGAVGAVSKVQEKDVTLAFAREFADELNRQTGIRAFLVRDKDVFVSLSERVMLARQRGAKLLISLHADILKQKDIRGATVYTISDKASDALAAGLAERENLSDDIGGVELKDEPAEVTDILIDLTRRETQAFSIRLAESVVKAFEGEIELINNPHRHAGFRVLRAPDVPSVLVEMGFLSNPEDEKLLTDETWRKKLAGRLVESVVQYRKESLANGG